MKSSRSAWLTYTALRLLFFAVPFALVYALGLSLDFSMAVAGIVAAVLATLIAASLSIIFLAKPRETASASIHDWRTRERTADDIVEDAVVDAEETDPAEGSERSRDQ